MMLDKMRKAGIFIGEYFFGRVDRLMEWFCFILPESSKFQYIKVTDSFNIFYSVENSFVTHSVIKFCKFTLLKLKKN